MPSPDPASAARRVAAKLAPHRGKDLTGQCLILDGADALALLPVLDAVGAEPGEDRVERYARAICRAAGNREVSWEAYTREARAAIALADAERAAKLPAG